MILSSRFLILLFSLCTLCAVSINADLSEAHCILGVDSQSDLRTIRKAHRNLALKFHPDKNPNCTDCVKKLEEINASYELIIEEAKANSDHPEFASFSSELFVLLEDIGRTFKSLSQQEQEYITQSFQTYIESNRLFPDAFVLAGKLFSGYEQIILNPIFLIWVAAFNLFAFIGFLWTLSATFKIVWWTLKMVKVVVFDIPRWAVKRLLGREAYVITAIIYVLMSVLIYHYSSIVSNYWGQFM